MRQHLGVGVGAKGDPGGLEAGAQHPSVLDDAVMDDRNTVCPIAMRVGIAIARLAMCRPARVRNAGRTFKAMWQEFLEFADASLAFGETYRAAAVDDRHACRIVA